MTKKTSKAEGGTLLLPIGGCGEFGRNMTALVTSGRLYLIDSGIMFADQRKLGVSSLFNDITPITEKYGKPTAYIITHGHEDHIGSLAYTLRLWPADTYIPRWALALVKLRLDRLGLKHLESFLKPVDSGDKVKIGDESFEYIRVNHSIPHANAVFIKTKDHSILHSGDFKIDMASTEQPPADMERFKKIGKEGVDLFICDSTNAGRPGIGPGENTTVEPLRKAMSSAHGKKGRTFVTTFSSNLWRLINIIDVAHGLGKKVCIVGTGMLNCIDIAKKEGIYEVNPEHLVSLRDISKYDDKDLIFLVSGSQAEFRSTMQRMTSGEHKQLKVKPGDHFIFSSRMIPGNEREVAYLTSKIRLLGGSVITPNDIPGIHVSGHAYGGEIELLLKALTPKYFMPVHGTFNQIIDNAENQGLNFETVICENGRGVHLKGRSIHYVDVGELDNLYIDDTGRLIYHETMRERLRIGENGAIFLSGVYSFKKKAFTAGPKVQTFGLVNEKPKMDEMKITGSLSKRLKEVSSLEGKAPNPGRLNEEARIHVRKAAFFEYKKKPTVVSQIWFVD